MKICNFQWKTSQKHVNWLQPTSQPCYSRGPFRLVPLAYFPTFLFLLVGSKMKATSFTRLIRALFFKWLASEWNWANWQFHSSYLSAFPIVQFGCRYHHGWRAANGQIFAHIFLVSPVQNVFVGFLRRHKALSTCNWG